MEKIIYSTNIQYNKLYSKIKSTRLKESVQQLLGGLSIFFAISLFAIVFATIIEYLASGDVVFRTGLFVGCGVITLASFILFFIPTLLRLFGIKGLPTINQIALRVGDAYPEVKDKLANAIQLIDKKEKNIGSSEILINAVVDDVYSETKDLNFSVIIQEKKFYISMLIMLFAVFGFIGINNVDGLSQAYHRLTHFSQAFIPPAPFTLTLETKKLELLRGNKAEIVFSSQGQAPDYINIYIKEENQKEYDEFRLKKDNNNKYKYEIASVKQNMGFYGAAEWITSSVVTDIGTLKVIDIPSIRSLLGRLISPSYANLSPRDISEMSADITALTGSNVDFTITSNKKIKNAHIVFEKTRIMLDDSTNNTDTFRVGMRISDNKASGGFRINQNGFYYFVIEDFDGLQNINPIKYSVVALSDGSPTISLLYPTTDVQVTEQALLPMKLAISDDYGFSSLKLYYRLVASKFAYPEDNFNSIPIKITSNELAQEINYIWDMNKINIVPEDIFEFYLEVADNDAIGGYKKARTQVLKVRLPSLAEVAKQAENIQNQANKDLNTINKEAEQLKKNIEELQRDVMKKDNKELDWKQKKQLQDIIQKQQNLEDKLKDVSEQLGETTKQLQENNMLSQETMQKYQELQQLLNEVKSPQLDKMRQMSQDQLNKMTPDELRKAMEQAKFDEEKFSKMIERTMEILKRMKAEQKTDALSKRIDELQKKQDELNKEMNNTSDQNKLNDLAKQQEQLKDELKDIAQEMKSLENLMKEIGENEMPMQEMKDAMNSMEKDNIDKDMQDASNEMQKGDKNKADKSQKSASEKLQKLAQQTKKMKSEMQNNNSKEVTRKFQKAIDNLAKISKQQEKAKNNTKNSNPNSTRIPDISKEQANIAENLYNTGSDLMEVAGKTFAITQEMINDINDGLKNMRDGMEDLTDRKMNNAANKQTSAMKNINSAMMQLQDALQNMQNGGGSCDNPGCSNPGCKGECKNGQGEGQGQGGMTPGGMGFGQKMQQMAAEQQALNQQMQEMMNSQGGTNPGQYTQEQRAGMKRLADDQERMRKSIEEMGQEQKDLGGKPKDRTEGNKLANELKKLSDEMKEVTSDIKSGNITPETLQRQERILSKMLDATRSVNERDFEKNRESKTGIDKSMRSPAGIDLTTQEGKTRAMQQLLNSIKQGYTKDYEQVIRQYLEAIQKNY